MPQPKTPSAPSNQGRSASGKVPGAGLHSISTTGKRYGMAPSKVALTMPSYAPHCASTTPTGYTCPELRTNPYRPGSADAFSLPSRTSFAKK